VVISPPDLQPLPTSEAFKYYDIFVDALKALNVLGILWAGRGQVHKSLLYLLTANKLYISTNFDNEKINKKVRNEIEDSYTHNCFYLAQAYGHYKDTNLSSKYCHLTLQRQYTYNLKDVNTINNIKTALDWVKNCGGISDFYIAMNQYHKCALALSSAEFLLKRNVIPHLADNYDNNHIRINATEIEAELHKKWINLDVFIFKRAYDINKEVLNAIDLGVEFDIEKIHKETINTLDFDYSLFLSNNNNNKEATYEFFEGIPVVPTTLLDTKDICDFESARALFLRATSRIEFAKRHYVLDGTYLLLL
jgi:hypothetical protein